MNNCPFGTMLVGATPVDDSDRLPAMADDIDMDISLLPLEAPPIMDVGDAAAEPDEAFESVDAALPVGTGTGTMPVPPDADDISLEIDEALEINADDAEDAPEAAADERLSKALDMAEDASWEFADGGILDIADAERSELPPVGIGIGAIPVPEAAPDKDERIALEERPLAIDASLRIEEAAVAEAIADEDAPIMAVEADPIAEDATLEADALGRGTGSIPDPDEAAERAAEPEETSDADAIDVIVEEPEAEMAEEA